jgi:hypothetical protein
MSIVFSCDDKPTLIAYLYGEVEPAVRSSVDAHLAACAACAGEVRALGDVRAGLEQWAPPDAELGFAIVRRSDVGRRDSDFPVATATVLRPARWWTTVPAWAQAAAAVLVLAAGAAIANVQVRSDANGFVVTTGWMTPALPTAAGPTVAPQDDQAWKTALVSLEEQLRTEIRTTREQATPAASAAGADEATLRRVRQLLAESEQRQEQAMAVRFVEFNRDMNIQRRADLVRITNSLGQFDEQMFRQRQMMNSQQQIMNNVLRVSGTPQQ